MQLYHKIINLKKYKFVILCVFVVVLIAHTTSNIILSISPDKASLTNPLFENESLIYIFIIVVIFGPLLETILFQYFIIEFLLFFDKLKKNRIITLIISSLIFGLSHSFNVYYFFFGLILGILLSLCYLLAKTRKDIHPFLFTLFIHSSYNLFVFFINEII
jgi:membrane protease YdiL (CAAX protease family)